MSSSYSAGQYDSEFASKRLNMYQVPKSDTSKKPQQRKDETAFIANEKGHLLPGVPKSDSNPFGDFVGTWDLPKSIPGPYHLVKTGRTGKNIQSINEKKVSADSFINDAREKKKPLNLRREESQDQDTKRSI